MKKIISAVAAFMLLGSVAFAQDNKMATGKDHKMEHKKEHKSMKMDKKGHHLKKDGTPDMRYKENKKMHTTHKKMDKKMDNMSK